jgi:drug/metabolite transporter (DMT)-like permease
MTDVAGQGGRSVTGGGAADATPQAVLRSLARRRMPLRHGRLADLALLVVLGSAWGLQITLMKAVAVSPLGASAGLGALLALMAGMHVLGLVALGGRWRPDGPQARFLALSALTGFIVPLGAIMAAAAFAPAGLIVLLESLTPVATIVLALALGAERVSPGRAAAGVCGVAAAYVLLAGDAGPAASPDAALGGAIALAAPLSYAANALYVARRWPAGLSVRQAAAGEVAFAAAAASPALLVWGGVALPGTPPWAWGLVAAAAAAGLVQGYVYLVLLRRGSAVFATLGSFVSLGAGVAWGMALLGESHPPTFWLAGALIATALLLAVCSRAA